MGQEITDKLGKLDKAINEMDLLGERMLGEKQRYREFTYGKFLLAIGDARNLLKAMKAECVNERT